MTPAEIFHRLLDESAATIAHPGAHALPADELHTEILLPLLPSMLCDPVIRKAWLNPVGRGFFSKMQIARETGGARPEWTPDDFEIHVTSSYLAGPDAKALADTLLSEPSLRDLTAALMNQLLEIVWCILPPIETAPSAPQPAMAETAPEPPAPVIPTWQWIAAHAKSAHLRLTGSSLPLYVHVLRALRRPASAAHRTRESAPPSRRKKFH